MPINVPMSSKAQEAMRIAQRRRRKGQLAISCEIKCREYIARWMIAHSYTTGHGNTIDDLLFELAGQSSPR
jgi:hypothetical protein